MKILTMMDRFMSPQQWAWVGGMSSGMLFVFAMQAALPLFEVVP